MIRPIKLTRYMERRYETGGGGGGSDEYSAMKKQEDAKKEKALRELQVLFGLTPGYAEATAAPTVPMIGGRKGVLNAAEFARLSPADQKLYAKNARGSYQLSQAPAPARSAAAIWSGQPATAATPDFSKAIIDYFTQLDAYNKNADLTGSGEANRQLIDQSIKQQEQAVYDYLTPQQNEYEREVKQRTTDRLAAQSLLGSSPEITEMSKVENADQRARRAISGRAKNAATSMRGNIMNAYSDLARQIAAGGDFSASAAQIARNNAMQQASVEEPWQNFFDQLGLIADLQAPSAYTAAMQNMRRSSTSPGSVRTGGSSGYIYNP